MDFVKLVSESEGLILKKVAAFDASKLSNFETVVLLFKIKWKKSIKVDIGFNDNNLIKSESVVVKRN